MARETLNKKTISRAGNHVNGNFYNYMLSYNEIREGIIYLALNDPSYKIDAAMIFAQLWASKPILADIRWSISRGLGLIDIREAITSTFSDGQYDDVMVQVPYGIKVVSRKQVKFPYTVVDLERSRYSALQNHLPSFVHYITPKEKMRGFIEFDIDTAMKPESGMTIIHANNSMITNVSIFDNNCGETYNHIDLSNNVRIGDSVWLPVMVNPIYSYTPTHNFGLTDPYAKDAIKNYIFETDPDITRKDLETVFTAYNGPFDIQDKPLFSKKETLGATAEEAAQAMSEFGNTLKISDMTDTIMTHGTSQDWIKYSGVDPTRARADLRDIVWKMLRNGHSLESVTASISLTSLFFQKEFRAKRDKLYKEVTKASKEKWFKTYLRTQPKSRFEVVEDINVRVIEHGEDVEKILGEMQEIATKKERNDKINHWMGFSWVKQNIALGINTPAYLRKELEKAYPYEEKVQKLFSKLINEIDECERENAIKRDTFIKRASAIGADNARVESYIENDMMMTNNLSKMYHENKGNQEALIINLANKLGLTVGSVNHKLHNLMGQGMTFEGALKRLEQVITLNSVYSMKPMVSPLKVIEIGAGIKTIADSEHKSIMEVQEMICNLASFDDKPVLEVMNEYIENMHIPTPKGDMTDAFFRSLSVDEHERTHEFLRKRFNFPVGETKGNHTGSETVTGNKQSVPNSSERGEQGTDRPSEESAIKPQYYGKAGIQPIDFIHAHGLSFDIGNVIKYVTRAGKKYPEKHVEDLEKAKYYLEQEIDMVKNPEKWQKRFAEMARLEEEERRKEDER